MKILIVSDTHRKDENLKEVIKRSGRLDMLIHLGDSEGSEQMILTWLNEGCDPQMVLGNNDFFSCLDREKEIMIGRYKTLLTHGHYYNVSVGAETLISEARSRDCDIVMYGHTHKPYYAVDKKAGDKDLIVLNPGSLSYPRQEGRRPSYMLMELDQEGDAHFVLNYL